MTRFSVLEHLFPVLEHPFPVLEQLFLFNTSYLTDSYISSTIKLESVSKNKLFDLKMMVKSGLEKNILKSLHSGT